MTYIPENGWPGRIRTVNNVKINKSAPVPYNRRRKSQEFKQVLGKAYTKDT